jgi:hypothetical protein
MRPHLIPAVLLVLLVTAGCDRSLDEAPSLIAQAQEQEQGPAAASGASPQQVGPQAALQVARAGGYVKRGGLHIDAPYLANREINSIAPEVLADQLGAQLARKELPETEEELNFEKADVWLYDGRIYRVRKKLAHPMDIPTALGTSGFPLDLGPPIESTSELRWNFTWNMRRITLERSREDERLYVAIDVYAFLPKEFF